MRKLYLTYVLAAMVPVGLFILVQIPLVWQWQTIDHVQQKRNDIKEEMLRLQWLTADIESGFRGYVLTNQAVFLHPVVTAEVKMQDSIDRILRLTQDMPNLQTRVKVLATRVRELIDSKRKLTSQIDQGKGDEVLAYIRAGEGLVLSKTIENAVEDFNTRLTEEFSRVDMEEKALMDQTFQRLLLADLAILAVGILVTWLIFRSIANGLTHRFSPTTIARQH